MRNTFCLIIFILFFSCINRQTNTSPDKLDEAHYIIDLDGYKEDYIPYSSVFKNVKTIILESKDDALIGSVREFQVFDGYIYIMDAVIAKSLFVFDMDGHFIRKIGRLGQGPGEYIQLFDFTIDTENGLIFVLDFGYFIHKYRLDGTYIHSIDVRSQIPRSNIDFIQFYHNRIYASVRTWEATPDDFMLMEMDPKNGKILSQSLPLKYNKGWSKASFTGHGFFISPLNNPPRYTQLFMDYIVSLGETITPYIKLKSKNLTTIDDFKNSFDEKLSPTGGFQVLQGTSKIWDVNSFVENDDLILFRCNFGLLSNRNSFSVVFYKETGSVKTANKMSNDLVSRQIDDENQFFISYMDGRFIFSDKKGAYEIVQPYLFSRFLKSIRNNDVVPNLDKLDELLKLTEDSNPVIFYYEFK